jgi:glycosyltransferase involved in cell wall biosynthesis
MTTPVTILMPVYNPNGYLLEALQSVLCQTYTDWKLVIVDDGSTNEFLEEIQDKLDHPKIHLIKSQRNLGQTGALNLGLSVIETPYVIQLDYDDLFVPQTLNTLLSHVEQLTKDVAVLYGNFLTRYEDAQGNRVRTTRQRGPAFKDRNDFLLKNCTLRPRFFRTDCLHAIGGWPTGGPFEDRFTEDRRILLRLLDAYRFFWVDRDLYIHRKHEHNLSNDVEKCEITREWVIRDALRRWGDKYNPIFRRNSSGRLRLIKLKRKK